MLLVDDDSIHNDLLKGKNLLTVIMDSKGFGHKQMVVNSKVILNYGSVYNKMSQIFITHQTVATTKIQNCVPLMSCHKWFISYLFILFYLLAFHSSNVWIL